MSKHAKHFSVSGHGAMRVSGALAVLPAMRCHRAGRARIGIAPARSFAKVFHSATGRLCTRPDNLPQLPQLALKKLGQRKPNKHAMPQLPQPAPTIFNVYQIEKEAARRVWCAGRELNSRRKNGLCNATVQLRGSWLDFPPAGNPNLDVSLG